MEIQLRSWVAFHSKWKVLSTCVSTWSTYLPSNTPNYPIHNKLNYIISVSIRQTWSVKGTDERTGILREKKILCYTLNRFFFFSSLFFATGRIEDDGVKVVPLLPLTCCFVSCVRGKINPCVVSLSSLLVLRAICLKAGLLSLCIKMLLKGTILWSVIENIGLVFGSMCIIYGESFGCRKKIVEKMFFYLGFFLLLFMRMHATFF